MPTLGSSVVTLSDLAKRLDPMGKVAKIVEMLEQKNDMLLDIPWMEANGCTSHRTTIRTGLPQVAWRLINQGVQPSKSTTAQVDESMGMLEAWSEVDCDLAKLSNDQAAFRLSEASPFLEAMNQEFMGTLIYGNSSVSPEEFTGLAQRYSDLSAQNAQNIIDAGGTGSDNASVWLVVWGENSVHGLYPKGTQAGLSHDDLGEETVETTAGVGATRMRAFRDRWQWKCGLTLRDWRYAVRICNIDISVLVANSSPADLVENMIKAYHRIPNLRNGKAAFYMNRTCFQFLDIQRRDAVQVGGSLIYADVDGRLIPSFRGIPVRIVDQLVETEARVV